GEIPTSAKEAVGSLGPFTSHVTPKTFRRVCKISSPLSSPASLQGAGITGAKYNSIPVDNLNRATGSRPHTSHLFRSGCSSGDGAKGRNRNRRNRTGLTGRLSSTDWGEREMRSKAVVGDIVENSASW
ncbi:unnamed protein product, partial [Choristocarpus tenellus]